ncbi:uncharacterized protein LOC130805231 isoform X2 [Amaranthus tricolor]|uniref:uncharacterized protein LOC130805231 isoform X2 n=1 Tax=Amaranthus tricolor TaxID=29722 RepID=UPI002585E016|nr:uncharacterized protein LOC130805231 isoform X2 [Amaranthus tricolor]
MKFQRGSRVEVLSDKDSLGAWRCAEIVEDTGDGYRIRYHRGAGIAKGSVKKVSAKAIRPCPGRVAALKNLGVGDVVEVLDDGSWRVSVIQEDMGDDYYYIGVIGSLDEFRVKNSSIRVRQEWKEDKWIPNQKSYWDLAPGIRKKSYVQPQGNSLKRSSPDHGVTCESLVKNVKKQKVVHKDVVLEAIRDSYSFIGEVDNSASQKRIQCKDDVQPTTKESFRHVNLTATIDVVVKYLCSMKGASCKAIHAGR